MQAIMLQIQAKQEKAYVLGQAGGENLAKMRPDAFGEHARSPSHVAANKGAPNGQSLVASEVVSKPSRASIAEGKRSSERGAKSPVKKLTEHLVQKKSQGEGSDCHVIGFPGDSSTMRISAEMISATKVFSFLRMRSDCSPYPSANFMR